MAPLNPACNHPNTNHENTNPIAATATTAKKNMPNRTMTVLLVMPVALALIFGFLMPCQLNSTFGANALILPCHIVFVS